jgi:hypothetical protein
VAKIYQKTVLENGSVIEATYDEDVTKVTVISGLTGLKASAYAVRMPEDLYDESVGYNVAYYRALGRLSRKLEKFWSKASVTKALSY